jgi:predicted ester cyclase
MICVLLAAAGCGPVPDEALEANKEIARRFGEAQNSGDLEALRYLLAPGFTRHCQATPDVEIRSREQFLQFYDVSSQAFTNAHVSLELLVAEGDLVAAYGTFTGTQDGPMGQFPPSGRQVDSKFLSIMRIADGQVAELWVEWDNLAILTQLGHFPPQGE